MEQALQPGGNPADHKVAISGGLRNACALVSRCSAAGTERNMACRPELW
jgi:hypothetical protein